MECLRHCLPSLITLSGVCLLEVIFGSRKASVLQVGGTAEGVSRVEPLPQLVTPLVSLKSWLPGPSLGRRPSEGSSSSRGLWVGLESWLRGPQSLPHGDAGHTPPQPQAPTGKRETSLGRAEGGGPGEKHRCLSFPRMSQKRDVRVSSQARHVRNGTPIGLPCLSHPAGQQSSTGGAGDFLDSFRFS